MTYLDAVASVLGKRLTRLGVSFTRLSAEEAALRIPILGPEDAQHFFLEATPTVIVASLYEVRGPLESRSERVTQLKKTLEVDSPSFLLNAHTWSHAFMNRAADVLTVFYGMEATTEATIRRLVRSLVTTETIGELNELSESMPSASL